MRADAEPRGTYGFLTARHRRDCARFNLRDCSRGQACPLKSGRFRSDDTEFGFSWKRPWCLVTSVMMTCGPPTVRGEPRTHGSKLRESKRLKAPMPMGHRVRCQGNDPIRKGPVFCRQINLDSKSRLND